MFGWESAMSVCVVLSVLGNSHTVSRAVSLLLARAMWNTPSHKR